MKCFLLSLFSFVVSYSVNEAHSVGGWQNYSSLALVDLFFMFIFGAVDIDLKRKRWISIGLFSTFSASLILTMIVYLYQYYSLQFIDSIALNSIDMYTEFSLVVSILIILIAVLPKRIVGILDDRFWPSFLAGIYSCNISARTKAIKEGAQKWR